MIHPTLALPLAREITQDAIDRAARFRIGRDVPSDDVVSDVPGITIRLARPGDAVAVELLARLDGAEVPDGVLLLGYVDGVLSAGVDTDGRAIADPFAPTAALVAAMRHLRTDPSAPSALRTGRAFRWTGCRSEPACACGRVP